MTSQDSAAQQSAKTGDPQTESEAPDYKVISEETLAKLQVAETNLRKLENDNKAIRTSRIHQKERDQRTDSLHDKADGILAALAGLAKAEVTGQSDGLMENISQIQAQSQYSDSRKTLGSYAESLAASLEAVVTEVDGLDLSDSRFDDMARKWEEAANRGDLGGIIAAQSEGVRIVREIERAQLSSARDEARAAAEQAAKQQLDDAGILDLDTGPGAGGAKSSRLRWGDTGKSLRGRSTRDLLAESDEALKQFFKET